MNENAGNRRIGDMETACCKKPEAPTLTSQVFHANDLINEIGNKISILEDYFYGVKPSECCDDESMPDGMFDHVGRQVRDLNAIKNRLDVLIMDLRGE